MQYVLLVHEMAPIRTEFFISFFRFRVGKQQKKNSENDQLTGHFPFFNISRTNSKTSKVNQQIVLNL